ncbi:PQQ-dependent sugar dehydrogenase [Dyadobacter sp. CY351]|uniref:PQQ-dependent sugar dehydrogenase n=2 Tax=Spirosomataceae TaxID=2896860 RepID=A0ABY4XNN1_9BACT|nr:MULTISPECIES: PQQ-dependent sugar dehydrogenase [Dyadobacter]MCF2494804.1 PQQ-dependent sugar dehydrogenase [Dyadobacter chenhuakuii]MCF2519117.1 PQQ-dependent sugar dehydrogenase [Dyadobacter sp. CY351]USJ31876.1 PQQ-dependent sugar dehydrogenase [Dyadobacter chenhuakuii]
MMMNNPGLLKFAFLLLLSVSCKQESEPHTNPEPGSGQSNDSTSVEVNAPNSRYTPAFAGQTRIRAVRTEAQFVTRIVTDQLTNPWGITSLPDGGLLITQKGGQMRIVSAAGVLGSVITGLPAVNAAGQGGLLGLCLDPQFESNRLVYWVFSEPVAGGSLTSVGRGRLSSDASRVENAAVIYRATPSYTGSAHYGGRILFDRTGHLLVSTGERSDMVTRPQSQSLSSGLGKIVRITTDGRPGADNPFVGQSNARPEIWSLGHRNPQGLAMHPVTGELWESEHGPRGGDEINRVQAGGNYGWPTITYGLEYSGQPVGAGIQQRDGLLQPAYYWDPVISPSGMTFYSGNSIPEWENNLFIGSLSGMHIARLVIENNRIVGEERLLVSEQQRFRDITQGRDGALYAVTDQGRLYRIASN